MPVQILPPNDTNKMHNTENLAETRNNNFDFLRLIAAFMVLYSHQYPLMGNESPYLVFLANNWGLSLGSLGVAIFFVISGYLVTQSWERDAHPVRYIVKRFLRVWPGLAVATLLAAFIIGPLASKLTLHEYFHDPRTWNYLRALYLKIIFPLPGVFEDNPFPNAVNGSLWTVRIEFRWYLYLLALGIMTLAVKPDWRRSVFLVAIVTLAIYYFCYGAQTRSDRSWTMDYGLYFCVGALMCLYRDKWKSMYWWLAITAGVAAYCLGQTILSALMIIAPTMIVIGTSKTPIIKDAGRFGDLSYGIYIYAFMIQQTVVWYFGDVLSFPSQLILVVVITLVCAFFSWHLIEKPALSLKKYIVRKNKTE